MNTHPKLTSLFVRTHFLPRLAALCFALGIPTQAQNAPTPAVAEVRNASIKGGWDGERASLIIQADLQGVREGRDSSIQSAVIHHAVRVTPEKLFHDFAVSVEMLQGQPRELVLTLAGTGEVSRVAAPAGGVLDWAIRQGTNGVRQLVVRLLKSEVPITRLPLQILAETRVEDWEKPVDALTVTMTPSSLSSGYVRVDTEAGLEASLARIAGLTPMEVQFLPETLKPAPGSAAVPDETQAYRFHGAPYELPLRLGWADPEAGRVVLQSLKLVGELRGETAAFILSGVARVKNPKGGEIQLLGGRLALTGWKPSPHGRLRFEQGRYLAVFDEAGEFPIEVGFNAGVAWNQGWSGIDVKVARSVLPRLELKGLARETQFRTEGAPIPQAVGEDFVSFLPPTGELKLQWRETGRPSEGVLFFSVQALSQVIVRPGLMHQSSVFDYKVMQGELKHVGFLLRGGGEVTRVQGPQVLSWTVAPVPDTSDRRLTVQLNQNQKDQFSLQIQTQTPLGLFPLAVEMLQVRPEGALRTGGFLRLLNEGAVRLEVLRSTGLSQISPDQFPQTDAAKALGAGQGSQVFAYRFSGETLDLRFQADNILPELSASQILLYHYGENDLSVEMDLDLEVREAPMRELVLRVPKGFAVARLSAAGLGDYSLTEPADQAEAQLRLVYTTPVLGRQLVNLRLEQNRAPAAGDWTLPRMDILRAKSVRGHLGITADMGFRLTAGKMEGLSEVATAFFPKKVAGLHAASRIQDPSWSAVISVERLPQSVQADVFHLFSVGEGIANGSSLIHYLISGAPVSVFRVGLSNEYLNVEFSGRDLRSWQKVEGGYLVQLHSPVSGAYPLLVTFERPFRPQGERVTFNGARPLDAQSEQGHTVIVSSFPFQTQPPASVPGWVVLEPGEIPADYRLFFDAPVLAAYRYSARPADLALELKPLVQGETVNQVADRGVVTTRISKDGQVVTDLQYFVKNKGAPTLRLSVPAGMQLWSVTINGSPVVPVQDGRSSLLPMPQQTDPSAVNDIRIKVAARSSSGRNLTLSLPALSAPVLLSEWRLEPESGRRLVYRGGSITPADPLASERGLRALLRILRPPYRPMSLLLAGLTIGLSLLALWVVRIATAKESSRFSLRHLAGGLVGLIGFCGALGILGVAADFLSHTTPGRPAGLRFLIPVQPPDQLLSVDIQNLAGGSMALAQPGMIVFLGLAAAAWGLSRRSPKDSLVRRSGATLAWILALIAAGQTVNPGVGLIVWTMLFLAAEVLLPSVGCWMRVPFRPPSGSPPQSPQPPSAPAVAVWLLSIAFSTASVAAAEPAAAVVPVSRTARTQADQVLQEVRVVEGSVQGVVKIQWQARPGEVLPLLQSPGVLTGFRSSEGAGRLVELTIHTQPGFGFRAEKTGRVELEFQYQLPVVQRKGDPGFVLPVVPGVVNRVVLTVTGLDVDLQAPLAISSFRRESGNAGDSAFEIVLPPASDTWIGWTPRSRDTRRERAVFYADWIQVLLPGAGVVDGLHQAQIRPAQGEVGELLFDIPAGATITDVTVPSLLQWRFDPTDRKLRVVLSSPQSKPFLVRIESQFNSTTLPFTHASSLVDVAGAAGQVGLLGLATSPEVQLDDVKADAFVPISLEDFPSDALIGWRGASAAVSLRRAFRFSQPSGEVVMQASQVAPDVRVESKQTLSLGDDRTVLAAGLDVEITRAGLFKLSFVLAPGFDVESISGEAMSHWTELKTDTDRVITLHLKGRTEGKHSFAVTLAGAGTGARLGWTPPRLVLRESEKQRGSLVLIPEQGLKLQITTREGLTQLDPGKSGLRQKGVLAFRLLQANWNLLADVERVEAWTQVTSFQSVLIAEARVRVGMNLVYDIDNAGTRTLRLALPHDAENVQFAGEQVADFVKSSLAGENGRTDWEVRLHRRVIGKFQLQLHYHLPLSESGNELRVLGVQARDVNLQRGYLGVQSKGRLRLDAGPLPSSLHPAEWQSIPGNLRQGLEAEAASHVYRLVEPGFDLALRLTRHDVVKLLPARVHSAALTSAVSDDGTTLTRVLLQMTPGDKQLLPLTLPERSSFWFAFVNQGSVWPWKEKDQLLIPLERSSKGTEPIQVEFYYLTPSAGRGRGGLDLALLGPKLDLPLEQITWNVFLSPKWHVNDWGGSLELRERAGAGAPASFDLAGYAQNEVTVQRARSQEAEQFLSMANSLLEKGNPEQARRALQSAYGLSQHDNAFNEDARVQLHNLKTQQALVGLNLRQALVAGEAAGLAQLPASMREGSAPGYTQQEAKGLLDRNSAEDAAAQRKLVERLIQQQETVIAKPAAMHASLPEQGQRLSFTRALQIDAWTDLKITLRAAETRPFSGVLQAGLLVLFLLAVWGVRRGMDRVLSCPGPHIS